MYLGKRKGYWLEVYRDGKELASMWHMDYNFIIDLAQHNIQLGNKVKITNCVSEEEE